ncbi:hypothetical protein HU200_010011 [Digitaria exilis]|uniref:Wall-associated receptor kinase galacturonan-binding domain-containing protein n=1 Tax=Digitaria exilis TaxID=1010633 RepID=A0A835FJV4_9POAL|nr:hypothetical protein HU200_010011 [Digitaria exilis]
MGPGSRQRCHLLPRAQAKALGSRQSPCAEAPRLPPVWAPWQLCREPGTWLSANLEFFAEIHAHGSRQTQLRAPQRRRNAVSPAPRALGKYLLSTRQRLCRETGRKLSAKVASPRKSLPSHLCREPALGKAFAERIVLFAESVRLTAKSLDPVVTAEQHEPLPITRPGCPDKCGDVSIPFPFGTKHGCFREGFEVICDDSLIDISVGEGTARAYGAVASACMTNATGGDLRFTYTTLAYDRDGADGTFLVSLARNILVGVGMDVSTTVSKFHTTPTEAQGVNYPVNCQSILAGNPKIASNGSCSGRGCCQASLLTEAFPLNAMVVEKSWYNFSTADLYGDTSNKFPRGVPYVFDFAIRNVSCPADGLEPPDDYACVSGNSTCVDIWKPKDEYRDDPNRIACFFPCPLLLFPRGAPMAGGSSSAASAAARRRGTLPLPPWDLARRRAAASGHRGTRRRPRRSSHPCAPSMHVYSCCLRNRRMVDGIDGWWPESTDGGQNRGARAVEKRDGGEQLHSEGVDEEQRGDRLYGKGVAEEQLGDGLVLLLVVGRAA